MYALDGHGPSQNDQKVDTGGGDGMPGTDHDKDVGDVIPGITKRG
jgi:hypothetical protein